ncbi:hypothetical protein [Salinispora arenicola]|uniref:hypothetical protein n=1 Tax=Salinispora arenicola TaxID=168697 RepID=UPI0027DCA543|nr:hypothetical protein [Salinispora arenicola]
MQAYTTNLHPNTLRQPAWTALLRPILGGSEVRRGVLAEWVGEYDDATGINLDPSLEQFVL